MALWWFPRRSRERLTWTNERVVAQGIAQQGRPRLARQIPLASGASAHGSSSRDYALGPVHLPTRNPLRLLRSTGLRFESFGLDLFHQSLQWTPTDLTEVSIVIRHEAPAVADAVDVNVRPSQVAVRFAVAAIANESCFGSHAADTKAVKWQAARKTPGREPAGS